MKLRRLHIENFRAIKDRSFSFEDELGRIRPLTVLVGPNGSGKTSVMFAIMHALRGVMGYRTADVPEPSDREINRTGMQAEWSPQPAEIRVELDLHFDGEEMTAVERVFEESRSIESSSASDSDQVDQPVLPDLPDGRLQVTWKYPPGPGLEGKRRPWWHLANTEPRGAIPWLQGYRRAVGLWNKRELSDFALLERIGGIYLFPQDRSLLHRVIGEPDGSFDEEREVGLIGSSGPKRHPPMEISVWDILDRVSRYAHGEPAGARGPLADLERIIKELFGRICVPKEYAGFLFRANDPSGAPCIQDKNTAPYPLNLAASGEQVIMEYIARLTFPTPKRHSLILIDEPEVHLHPGWIRQVYQALPGIGTDNQYIVTTHSPELRAMAAEDDAIIDLGTLAVAAP